MADIETVRDWQGRTMIDLTGSYLGSVEAVYVDERSGRPEWALVRVGVEGTRSTFVPIAQATTAATGYVRVPFQKQLVEDAPGVAPDRGLSADEERELFLHYGLDYGQASDDAMTRSEEELRVGTEARERGRVRLRKYVDTEQVQLTVPVRREKLRLEWEPAADADVEAASSGPELTDSEDEVVLHVEEPVVDKRVVPRERVRLAKETVTEEQQVSEELRKERIDLDDQTGRDRRP